MSQLTHTSEPDANPETPSRSLAELEHIVEKGKAAFLEVGEALAEIHDRKLYRELGFHSFEAYVDKRLGFSRAHGYRLMSAAKAVKLSPNGRQIKTEREANKRSEKRSAPKKSKPSSPTKPVRMPSSIPVQAVQPESSVPMTRTKLADPTWGLPLEKASVKEEIDVEIEYGGFERQADLWVAEFKSEDLMFLLARVIECCRELISEAKDNEEEEEEADEDYSLSSVSELEEVTADV
jgi:hypothetical protein